VLKREKSKNYFDPPATNVNFPELETKILEGSF